MNGHIALAAIALATLPAAAIAQSGPYRLLITYPALEALDYPSKARCEAALQTIRYENAARQADADARMRKAGGGGVIIPQIIVAICIPG